MLGFDDIEKRNKSVELLIRSMEYADRYGAKAVVVHPGEVPFDYNIDAELKRLYREQGKNSEAYRQLWNTMMERRERYVCDQLSGSGVRLWYDIGHAVMMERMGLYNNDGQLEQVKHHIYGVHIHETLELSDHWCPYVHSNDMSYFDKYLDIIDRAQVKVYELKAA